MSADEQGLEQWKQKYYDQLDRLEQKESDWEQLETTLKRTIGRLSLAAEGQHSTLDRHIAELRTSIKNKINRQRVESIVDDISRILGKLEEKSSNSQRSIMLTLEQLLKELPLSDSLQKPRNKLLQQIEKSSDDHSATLISKTVELLSSAISQQKKSVTQDNQAAEIPSTGKSTDANKPGFLERLFHSDKNTTTDNQHQTDLSIITSILVQLLSSIPWPESLNENAHQTISQIGNSLSEHDLNSNLNKIEDIITQWPTSEINSLTTQPASQAIDKLSTYKTCLLELLDKIDNRDSPSGKLAALKLSAQHARDKDELDSLSAQLSSMLVEQPHTEAETAQQTDTALATNQSQAALRQSVNDPSLQPSIQELLIRLLEQLIVPAELESQADKMKQRLEQDTDPANWKLLLKDVASLINSIRSYMQKEKHEFENFLHQVTDRLRSMDQFLQTETKSLQSAEAEGKTFDNTINLNVNEIRQDVAQATELSDLKHTVSTKLDTISSHIKLYRDSEKSRILQSQQQVEDMHTRMQELEKESETLKKVVIEKNKMAMFDTLTGIPNRLSYDKKIEEEVSRWKRFNNPLSLAIWDIDFFKKVNDTYGHKAGDKVLRTVAQLLHKRIRTTDFLARYGGEEFVMLLPGTQQEETLRLVNQLRQQVESCGFHNHGESVTITVSCGISSFTEGDTTAQVFDRADKALYKAKENGRNQCVAAACLS